MDPNDQNQTGSGQDQPTPASDTPADTGQAPQEPAEEPQTQAGELTPPPPASVGSEQGAVEESPSGSEPPDQPTS